MIKTIVIRVLIGMSMSPLKLLLEEDAVALLMEQICRRRQFSNQECFPLCFKLDFKFEVGRRRKTSLHFPFFEKTVKIVPRIDKGSLQPSEIRTRGSGGEHLKSGIKATYACCCDIYETNDETNLKTCESNVM